MIKKETAPASVPEIDPNAPFDYNKAIEVGGFQEYLAGFNDFADINPETDVEMLEARFRDFLAVGEVAKGMKVLAKEKILIEAGVELSDEDLKVLDEEIGRISREGGNIEYLKDMLGTHARLAEENSRYEAQIKSIGGVDLATQIEKAKAKQKELELANSAKFFQGARAWWEKISWKISNEGESFSNWIRDNKTLDEKAKIHTFGGPKAVFALIAGLEGEPKDSVQENIRQWIGDHNRNVTEEGADVPGVDETDVEFFKTLKEQWDKGRTVERRRNEAQKGALREFGTAENVKGALEATKKEVEKLQKTKASKEAWEAHLVTVNELHADYRLVLMDRLASMDSLTAKAKEVAAKKATALIGKAKTALQGRRVEEMEKVWHQATDLFVKNTETKDEKGVDYLDTLDLGALKFADFVGDMENMYSGQILDAVSKIKPGNGAVEGAVKALDKFFKKSEIATHIQKSEIIGFVADVIQGKMNELKVGTPSEKAKWIVLRTALDRCLKANK